MRIFGMINLLWVLGLLLSSCRKQFSNNEDVAQSLKLQTLGAVLEDTTFVSNPSNLNIIYFIPTDNPALSNYEKRLSDLFIHFQQFVTSEMNRNGFYGKTLGLPLDSATNRVKIITIYGAHDQTYYDYGSSGEILAEVNAYRSVNPSEFSSPRHNLIILPLRTDDGRQPFYGIGRNCFAVDFSQMSLDYLKTTSSSYIGGLFHELGHGLNLPHDRQKKTEQSTLGTTLMGSGNSTYGKSATFLSLGDCAILYRCEVFQPSPVADQYAANSTSIAITNATFDEDNLSILLEGTFTATEPVNHVMAYLDPITSSNTDHDSPMWAQGTSGNSFSFTIALADLYTTGNASYNLRLRLLSDQGTISSHGYNFSFASGVPVLKGDSVGFYKNCSYGGYLTALGYGFYKTSELVAAGIADNDVSGVKLPLWGVQIKLYDNDNFSGTVKMLTNSSECLQGISFNDKTSSVIIAPYGGTGKIRVYKHGSYGGTEVELGVGVYSTSELATLGVLDNDISSIKVPENMRVVLYDSDYLKGSSYTATSDISFLTSFNDMTSSIMVEQLN